MSDTSRFVQRSTRKDLDAAVFKHWSAVWFPNEIDMTGDSMDWVKLTSGEQHFVKMVLAFFAASDGIVMENIGIRFYNDVKIPEARLFYSVQLMMEGVHSVTYSRLIETLVHDEKEKDVLFNAIQEFPSIGKKADWAIEYIQSNDDFATRLVAFACVEGIFFSGSFCAIFWLNERGVMPGLCKSNEFISRDEGLHTDFACMLYKNYTSNKLDERTVHAIISQSVEIESEFITEALPCTLLGMNPNDMKLYIKFIANRLSQQLGYNIIYPNIKNPFGFMNRILLENKTNFFENRISEYQKNDTVIQLDDMELNDDF